MIAVDTNVLVRLVTNDTPAETARARALLQRERVFVPLTVVLETEWVLRSAYGRTAAQISGALRTLLNVPTIEVEDRARVATAIDWHDAGLDFADALHLAATQATPSLGGLATFDRKLGRRAARLASAPKVFAP